MIFYCLGLLFVTRATICKLQPLSDSVMIVAATFVKWRVTRCES